jgi:hypothetical protein
MYTRDKPLPPFEDKFEGFYIRYAVDKTADGSPCSLDAEVWETCEWTPEGKPVFFNGGPNAPGVDPGVVEPLFTIWVKWDGCSHLRLPYFHFDNEDELDALKRCVAWVRDDLCEKNGVTD